MRGREIWERLRKDEKMKESKGIKVKINQKTRKSICKREKGLKKIKKRIQKIAEY